MIHYHGTPVTPATALLQLAGRHFCVRATAMDRRAAEFEAMLPGLPDRTERTVRRHARASRGTA